MAAERDLNTFSSHFVDIYFGSSCGAAHKLHPGHHYGHARGLPCYAIGIADSELLSFKSIIVRQFVWIFFFSIEPENVPNIQSPSHGTVAVVAMANVRTCAYAMATLPLQQAAKPHPPRHTILTAGGTCWLPADQTSHLNICAFGIHVPRGSIAANVAQHISLLVSIF